MFNLDPSKLSPQVLGELSQLIQELPPEKLSQMQSIMHNSMAGYDTTSQLRDFENTLPPGFREKLARLMYQANGVPLETPTPETSDVIEIEEDLTMHSARSVVLEAVANGSLSPKEAEKILFPNEPSSH